MHKATLKIGVAAVLSTLAIGAAHAANAADADAAEAAAAPADAASAGSVIVTGTRSSGMKAENSASPIQVCLLYTSPSPRDRG